MAKDYTSTLNLPKTEFSMRANLPQREPEMLKYWESIDLYGQMQKQAAGKPSFILHDGPPFSNGNIHMGHALNKVLKDFIIKSKSMSGFRAPYVPGWDNHGMPIESAIIKQNKIDRKKMSIPEFRTECHKFAQKFVDLQREQFKRLGVTGDWDHPYLTMQPAFEAREVRVFGDMYKRGYIYKGMKPVYWCPKDETALAEAEIEYQTDKCTSIFVKFAVKDDLGKLSGVCDLSRTYFIIWTTTTWTLPGNLAIALNPVENYAVVKAGVEYYIVAEALCDKTMREGGVEHYEIVRTMPGQEFEYMKAQHPFLDRESLICNADYVTMDSGTGCVHTAPGFGADDFLTCQRYGIETVVPVDDKGYQTADAGKYAGLFYAESNDAILSDLKESGALFASAEMEHEYPHCWRCKNPIIFRATPQWFCSVDTFKDEACNSCDPVVWIPEWGNERMKQMVRERKDWCISRQRHWGLPIPVFYCECCKKPVCNDETIDAVADVFAEKGSNCWYELDASDILPKDFTCPFCGGKSFAKETDTLDGWFDSGSSHIAVLESDPALSWPADMYLEGADQYRGWFQAALLTAVGSRGCEGAPFRQVLTHGWTVDGHGHAMHKSLGNTIAPAEVIQKYGADLVRLWVASCDYHMDVRVSDEIFKQLSDAYRKIRNTARILLANLYDYDPEKDAVRKEDLFEIDKWVIAEMNDLVKDCRKAYDRYEFHIVYHAVNNFCTTQLSKLYVDITKDRTYTGLTDGIPRRSAQTAMYYVLSALTRLLAPMISFTAEEIWQAMPHSSSENGESVFLNEMPQYDESLADGKLTAHWDKQLELRDDVMKALETARADKLIGKSLDAKITIFAEGDKYKLLDDFRSELATVYIVSGVELKNGPAPEGAFRETDSGIGILVENADGCRCDRCWSYSVRGSATVDGFLCEKCKAILEKLGV
ncbi:MAG: isoleucine--tRNA ligase [Clostridia bacterium]|nr:isoleucine--tRNA ligase [Clostridia bacterium]